MKFWMVALLLLFLSGSASLVGAAFASEKPCERSLADGWARGVDGCLRFKSFATETVDDAPVLVVALHGDAPFHNPGYHYTFAEIMAEDSQNVIAVGLLRPGYTDSDGNVSAGVRGKTTGDNYTRSVADSVAMVIRQLADHYSAGKVLLAGHSGGAAITANVIGHHSGLVDAALLVACPCVLDDWRAHMNKLRPSPIWTEPIAGISPHDSAQTTGKDVRVVMMVGRDDDITPFGLSERYRDILEARGVAVELEILDGMPHNIFLKDAVIDQALALITVLQTEKPE
jgi:predicted esterase